MAYDEGIAQRVREMLENIHGVTEKKMFGGIAFLVNGNMCTGVVGHELMMRVGTQAYPKLLKRPYVRQMDFTGKPMKGFVFVSEKGFESDQELAEWVDIAHGFVSTLPAK